ncbi:MAG: hypothetical protein JWM10_3468 [Myxococcaceae bacterium]|nr:hypothetical protein [Myxococcaceae bacterium]
MPNPLVVFAAGLFALDALTSTPRRRRPLPRVSKPKKHTPKKRASEKKTEPDWHHFERTTCDALGAIHVGGPGRSDCVGPGFSAEVKHHKRRVGTQVVEKAHERGDAVVVSSSGFTSPAVRRAAELGVLLQHRFPRVSGR